MINCAPVAQLDRVGGFEPLGREFESLRVRQNMNWAYLRDSLLRATESNIKINRAIWLFT